MERYFLLIIVVTLVGVTTQKKNGQEANFRSTLPKERGVTAGITTRESNAGYTNILKRYTKFKTSGGTNPRTLFNILRSPPMSEPYFIQ